MASARGLGGFALSSVLAGTILVYAGIRGINLGQALRAVVAGKSPSAVPPSQQIPPLGGGSASPVAASSPGAGAAPGSGHYDHASLMTLWQQAGGSAATASNAACHAMQESSGDPKVTSPNPDGGTNVGLWQLDTAGVGAGYSVAQLQDAMLNARLTVMHTANGTSWAQWATPGC
jgi:hypothetical protein